jgi:cobalt-zinc-cadmium efflux system outer membrane protein
MLIIKNVMGKLLPLALVCAQLSAEAPMTLKQVVEEALERNLALLAQRYEISIAEARQLQARLRPNPRLNVENNFLDVFGANSGPGQAPAGPAETDTVVFFEIETAGKRRLRTEVARQAAASAREAFLDARRTLILEVQNAYLDLVLARENVRTLRDILQTFENLVKINKTRYEAGEIARVELLRSEVAALQFHNQLRQGELRARQEAVRLQRLMGRPAPAADFDVAAELRRDEPAKGVEELVAAALAARPDLAALRRELERLDAEVRLQRALALPNVDFGFSHHKQYIGPFPGQTAGFRFEIPLPLLNRNQGEIERARQEREQAAARVRALEQQIRAEAASAWEQHLTARQLLESIEKEMIAQAVRVRDIIQFSYRRGEASFIDLLDAQRTLSEAMRGYNEARVEYARTLYLLDAIAAREAP